MKRQQSSITAEGIALVRAIESDKPESERVCFDPYARYFTSRWMALLAGFFLRIGYADRRGPGVREFLVARCRYVDDYLRASIAEGMEQLVLLGAGFDSRALRFPELKDRIRVFEVDHPATQKVKLAKLRRIFGAPPSQVMYVPVDFENQALAQRLLDCGYDRSRRTLFIWEGVTQYLCPEAVDSSLAFIARNSGPGSSVIFDYVYAAVVDGRWTRGEAASMKRSARFTGEGMVFGIEEGTVGDFLARRGFERVRNVTSEDLDRLYFGTGKPHQKPAPVYAIASAQVIPGSKEKLDR